MATVLCRADDIEAGSGKEVMVETPEGRRWIALFRVEGVIRAYLNSCPHMGRSLCLSPDEFLIEGKDTLVCPHHGASFELSSGICMSGPCCGASLTEVEIEIADAHVIYVKKPD